MGGKIRIVKGKRWQTGGKFAERHGMTRLYNFKKMTSEKALSEALESLRVQGIKPTVVDFQDATIVLW